MEVTLFSNPTITTNGYTLTIGDNSCFVGHDNYSNGLTMYIYNSSQILLATRPVSVNTNMLGGVIPNQSLMLNPTSNNWEWVVE